MKSFTIFSTSTGQILRVGNVLNESDLPAQTGQGESLLADVSADWRSQRVNLGTFEVEEIPPVEPTLSELKAAAKARASQRKWEEEVGGVVFGGGTLATDDRSKLLITAAAEQARANPLFTVGWKMADGNFVTIDAATLIAAYDAVFAHVSACFAREAELAVLISACVDAAELTALAPTIEAFWP